MADVTLEILIKLIKCNLIFENLILDFLRLYAKIESKVTEVKLDIPIANPEPKVPHLHINTKIEQRMIFRETEANVAIIDAFGDPSFLE